MAGSGGTRSCDEQRAHRTSEIDCENGTCDYENRTSEEKVCLARVSIKDQTVMEQSGQLDAINNPEIM